MNVLKSKIQIPMLAQGFIPRPRLSNALEQNVIRHKLTVVSAPAGYGKTTLLSEWAKSSKLFVCWLSLDKEENNVERFLRYLLAAWETAQPEVMDAPVGILLGSQTPDIKASMSAFLNAADQASNHVVFVLDEYQLIEESNVHDALTFLLDHAPPSLHFVLAGRGEPPLPLARYRARGEMLELHSGDLRFSLEETRAFLKERMKLDLAPEELESLQAQMEGWIAGVQLAALTVRQAHEGGKKSIVSGKHRFIADYLGEDVLVHLLPVTQKFLLETSILDRLSGSLCESVTNEKEGQRMLETLEREGLFLMPLDENREWFRYHRLFADYLRQELMKRYPDEVPELHRRAARWYLENELPESAFQHAVDGKDIEVVTQILERYLVPKLLSGEIRLVQNWLESLPESWRTSYPMIAFARAGLLLVTGQFEACMRCLDEVEQLALAQGMNPDLYRAKVVAMRCNIACFQNNLEQAESFADQALRILPESELDFRAGVYGALGDTYRRNGLWNEAKESYLKLLNFEGTSAFRIQAVHLYGALADLDLRQGHLQSAAKYWMNALKAIQKRENWGQYPLPLIGWVYIRLSELYYEWNQLAEAWEHLSQGLERVELGGDVRAMIAGYLVAARLKLTEGDGQGAEEYLERARPYLDNARFAYWFSHFERLQLELWLVQDKLRTAINWADSKLKSASREEQEESEATQLTIARVLIIKGDQEALDRAMSLLKQLIPVMEEEGRMGIQIEALALQAILHWKRGEQSTAMTALGRALHLAEPEGYVRIFADFGLPMARLLQEARSRKATPAYVEKLLAAFGDEASSPVYMKQPLPEPLTEREADILELMAVGLSNREIAKELFISPGTVKKHTANIYGKLGVHSRTEAAARARELNLLGY